MKERERKRESRTENDRIDRREEKDAMTRYAHIHTQAHTCNSGQKCERESKKRKLAIGY